MDQPPFLISTTDTTGAMSTLEIPELLSALDGLIEWHQTLHTADLGDVLDTARAAHDDVLLRVPYRGDSPETREYATEAMTGEGRYWTTLEAISDMLLLRALVCSLSEFDAAAEC